MQYHHSDFLLRFLTSLTEIKKEEKEVHDNQSGPQPPLRRAL